MRTFATATSTTTGQRIGQVGKRKANPLRKQSFFVPLPVSLWTSKIKTSEKVDEKNEIAVIKKKEETHPIVNSDCKNCGHDKAYFWTVQTRSSDEAETKFFKCVKCGETSRDYS